MSSIVRRRVMSLLVVLFVLSAAALLVAGQVQILPVVPQVTNTKAAGTPAINAITIVPLGHDGAVLVTADASGMEPLAFAWFFLRQGSGGLLPPILQSQPKFDNSQLFTPDSFINTPDNPAVVWVVVANSVGVTQSLAIPVETILGTTQPSVIGGSAAGASSGTGTGTGAGAGTAPAANGTTPAKPSASAASSGGVSSAKPAKS